MFVCCVEFVTVLLNAECHIAKGRYAERCYSECRFVKTIGGTATEKLEKTK